MKQVEVYTDGACSGNPGPGGWGAVLRYRFDGINGLEKGWAKGWKRRGWKKADGSPALNPDLWAQALEQEARHKITYVWVKGHAGHPENERCDQLAVAQSKAHGGRQGT